jgi:hypothetical protein
MDDTNDLSGRRKEFPPLYVHSRVARCNPRRATPETTCAKNAKVRQDARI